MRLLAGEGLVGMVVLLLMLLLLLLNVELVVQHVGWLVGLLKQMRLLLLLLLLLWLRYLMWCLLLLLWLLLWMRLWQMCRGSGRGHAVRPRVLSGLWLLLLLLLGRHEVDRRVGGRRGHSSGGLLRLKVRTRGTRLVRRQAAGSGKGGLGVQERVWLLLLRLLCGLMVRRRRLLVGIGGSGVLLVMVPHGLHWGLAGMLLLLLLLLLQLLRLQLLHDAVCRGRGRRGGGRRQRARSGEDRCGLRRCCSRVVSTIVCVLGQRGGAGEGGRLLLRKRAGERVRHPQRADSRAAGNSCCRCLLPMKREQSINHTHDSHSHKHTGLHHRTAQPSSAEWE